MTMFHASHDDLHGNDGSSRPLLARTFVRFVAALSMIHRTTVAARMRRLRNEVMLHTGFHDDLSPEDAAKLPQRPLILGDKWDF